MVRLRFLGDSERNTGKEDHEDVVTPHARRVVGRTFTCVLRSPAPPTQRKIVRPLREL